MAMPPLLAQVARAQQQGDSAIVTIFQLYDRACPFSAPLVALLDAALTMDPSRRPNMADLARAALPWMQAAYPAATPKVTAALVAATDQAGAAAGSHAARIAATVAPAAAAPLPPPPTAAPMAPPAPPPPTPLPYAHGDASSHALGAADLTAARASASCYSASDSYDAAMAMVAEATSFELADGPLLSESYFAAASAGMSTTDSRSGDGVVETDDEDAPRYCSLSLGISSDANDGDSAAPRAAASSGRLDGFVSWDSGHLTEVLSSDASADASPSYRSGGGIQRALLGADSSMPAAPRQPPRLSRQGARVLRVQAAEPQVGAGDGAGLSAIEQFCCS